MKSKLVSGYLRTNEKHWDAMAKRNRREKAKWVKRIREGYPYLEKMESKIFIHLGDINGKKIIVPQFGDSLLLLACAKKGAIVTGVDLSSEQIRLAKEAAALCDVDVKLVKADWQNLPKEIPKDCFDLAVTECGIFIWIENLHVWMQNAYRVLKKDGRLIVSDFHPLDLITEKKHGKMVFRKSYFDHGPEVIQSAPSENLPPSIEFLWKLSDIINAAVEAGFQIKHVEEFHCEPKKRRVPLLPTDFLIVAAKL
jgi:SAM-dependent methyltransferase